jgi:hypothetical protein
MVQHALRQDQSARKSRLPEAIAVIVIVRA